MIEAFAVRKEDSGLVVQFVQIEQNITEIASHGTL